MITNCNCPKDKHCAGHLTLQEQKLLFTTSQYMNRDVDDDIVTVPTQRCIICSQEGTVEVIRKDWHSYQWDISRKEVKVYFPYLDKSGWEQIISGSHPKCFDELFGDENELD
jgi:hypothetical protein